MKRDSVCVRVFVWCWVLRVREQGSQNLKSKLTVRLVWGSILVLGRPSVQGKTSARDGSMQGKQDYKLGGKIRSTLEIKKLEEGLFL